MALYYGFRIIYSLWGNCAEEEIDQERWGVERWGGCILILQLTGFLVLFFFHLNSFSFKSYEVKRVIFFSPHFYPIFQNF